MNTPHRSGFAAIHFPPLLALVLTSALTGCYVSGTGAYTTGSFAVVASDDYVYYPGYEVYYSNTHHDYYYRDGDRWIRHREPPRGFVQTSPSVHMSFHDSPERHHAETVRTYPRTWRPHAKHDKDRDRDRDDRR